MMCLDWNKSGLRIYECLFGVERLESVDLECVIIF